MTQQLIESWFSIADADQDGAVGGAEAVSFFMRSGLPHTVLGQIWELASGGAAKLNLIQFRTAMRLVALAQCQGGQLPPEQVRAVISGVGLALPPPSLQGLEAQGPAATSGAPQHQPPPSSSGAAARQPNVPGTAPIPQPLSYGGLGAVSPYAAQLTGGAVRTVGAPDAGGIVNASGQSPAGAATGPSSVGAYPLLPLSELQRFQAIFVQLDTDRDGFLMGTECFTIFTQFGLDKAALRDIWSLVAGTESRLSGPQFVAFLYLVDCARRGLPLPAGLPAGLAGFPPVESQTAAAVVTPPPPATAPTWSLQSQFGTSSNITAVLTTPHMPSQPAPPPPPSIPPRLELPTGERVAPPLQAVSQVPAVAAGLLAGVSAMDRTKLQEEQQACESQERALHSVEERVAEARARQSQLTSALQELVVFRKRTELALLTSQDQARRLEEEVEATRKRYEAGYVAAQSSSEQSAAVHSHIMELMTQKAELEDKMRRLESEVAAAERMGPTDVARLEGELAELNGRCSALEVARNAKMAKVDGLRRQQEAARVQLSALQSTDRDVAAEMEAAQSALQELEAGLKEARSSGAVVALPALLSRAAALYRGLYGLAHRAGTTVPFDALPATLEGLHVWSDEVAAGVLDWPDDDIDARGFIVVNALPGTDASHTVKKASAARMPPNEVRPHLATESDGGASGVHDPSTFGDPPQAFGLSASSGVPGLQQPLPPSSTTFAAPIGFGFDDAPAFGAAFGAALTVTTTPPSSSSVLPAATSSVMDPAVTTVAGAGTDTRDWSSGSGGITFGLEPVHSLETPKVVVSAAVGSSLATAFEDGAFTASPLAAPAPRAVASESVTQAPVTTVSSLFGDDAFGFGSSAPAVAAAADSRSTSSSGALAQGLPTVDSGPMEENPFAWGAPAALVAAVASAAAATSSTSVSPPPVPLSLPPAAATSLSAGAMSTELFGDNAFGSMFSDVAPGAVVAPGAALPPPQHPVVPVKGGPENGFGDDNAFADTDNPFGGPAFR